MEDPFSDADTLVKRLVCCTAESKNLEWKLNAPVGPTVTVREKYRMVKAAVSFANTDGGFIVFGVASDGNWIGLTKDQLGHADPAKIVELISGCIFPEIPQSGCAIVNHKNSEFTILHVPPSAALPHITTKEIVERDNDGRVRVILAKHALYYRHGAKSDLATPHQHHRIFSKKADLLKMEMLRRVKEVPIPTLGTGKAIGETSGAVLHVTRVSKDPNAPAVRLTRARDGVSGTFMHEELSDGIFEEINNVLDANALLTRKGSSFAFDEHIYYRIYAERQHVEVEKHAVLLAKTGLIDLYAPHLFWFLRMPDETVAEIILEAANSSKGNQILSLLRLVTVIGDKVSNWLFEKIDKRWGKHPQPPDYFWSFKEIREDWKGRDRRLAALRSGPASTLSVPDNDAPIPIQQLLDSPLEGISLLSKACLATFEGNKDSKGVARRLDILCYGRDFAAKEDRIFAALEKLEQR